MDLTGNLLSGTIPASTVVPTGLVALLTGLQETVAMRRLSLASNLLEGTIPAGLWRFRLQACFGAWRVYCTWFEACSSSPRLHGTSRVCSWVLGRQSMLCVVSCK